MYALEYYEHLYNSQTQKKKSESLEHSGVVGMEWHKRRYQNLDGSLTPEGRLHYGVGMSREEMAEARAAEESRQREIDYNRSKSIREMDDYELQNAVNRSRMEQQFEANMIQRSNNFLQSKVTEERLQQEYDDLMYQKSRVKAERFMQRTERLGQFIGNLANSYGKIQDVKGKIEDVRAKKALADMNEWKSEQEHAKADKERWNLNKQQSEYQRSLAEKLASAKKDLSDAKADLDSGKSKKEIKAEAKAAKKAEKEAKKRGKEPEYIRKEGDTYIYDDSTKAGWESTKESKKKGILSKVFGGKEKKAEAKREALKNQAYEGIQQDRLKQKAIDVTAKKHSTNSDRGYDWQSAMVEQYNKPKSIHKSEAKNSDRGYDWQSAMVDQYNRPRSIHKSEAKNSDRGYDWQSAMVSQYNSRKNNDSVYNTGKWQDNSKYDWSAAMATSSNYNGGMNMSKAALKRAEKRRRGSWNK